MRVRVKRIDELLNDPAIIDYGRYLDYEPPRGTFHVVKTGSYIAGRIFEADDDVECYYLRGMWSNGDSFSIDKRFIAEVIYESEEEKEGVEACP